MVHDKESNAVHPIRTFGTEVKINKYYNVYRFVVGVNIFEKSFYITIEEVYRPNLCMYQNDDDDGLLCIHEYIRFYLKSIQNIMSNRNWCETTKLFLKVYRHRYTVPTYARVSTCYQRH